MLLIYKNISVAIVAILLAFMLSINSFAFAEGLGVEELQNLSNPGNKDQDKNDLSNDQSKNIDKDHWAYKILNEICLNHKVCIDDIPSKKEYITREEAAVLLINVLEKAKNELSEKEQVQLDILKQELNKDLQCLFSRVTNLETKVNSLQGSVSKLEQSDKKSLKFNYGEKLNIQPFTQALYAGIINKNADPFPANFSLPLSGVNIYGRLKPHLFYFTQISPSIPFNSPLRNSLSAAFAGTDIIPHNYIILGKFPVLIGAESSRTSLRLDTVNRAQISRNFGSIDTGLQVLGKTDHFSYYISAFNGAGTDIFQTEQVFIQPATGRNINFGERFVVRPFGYNQKIGTIELGSGFFTGRKSVVNTDVSYNLISYYAGYKKKKYALTAEYAQKKGFLTSGQFAYGWYVNNSYFLTDKIQLVARYDLFDPNTSRSRNINTEYTIGGNYFLSGINLKFQFNYVYVNRQGRENGQRILFLSQYVF